MKAFLMIMIHYLVRKIINLYRIKRAAGNYLTAHKLSLRD
jgi:hypothetical protein